MSYQVLLVDDEDIYLQYMQKMVKWYALDCQVCGCAHDGKEALLMVEKHQPDIIFMDINMSQMDGLEACTQLREKNCASKVIIMTAFDEFSFAQRAIKLNVFDYLLKPFDKEELTKTLKMCIEEIKKERKIKWTRQEMFLKEVLDSGTISQELESMGDIDPCDRYVVVLIPKRKEVSLAERDRFQQLLKSYFTPLHAKNYLLGNRKDYGVVIHALSEKNVTTGQIKEQYYRLIKEHPQEQLGYVVIGEPIEGIANLQDTYNSARLVFENRVKMEGWVHSFEDIEGLDGEITLPRTEDAELLIKAFELKKYHKVDKQLEKIFGLTHNQMFSFQYVITIYYTLVTEIYGYYRYKENDKLTNLLETQSNLIAEISLCSTREQMLEVIKNYIYEVFSDCIGVTEGSKQEVLAAEIEKYLQRHYHEQSLSIKQITEALYFENSYIRRVFKLQTGKTIVQRLEEIRMERAKEMLAEGVYKSSEIAEQTGYCDQQYFSKRFKLVCGCTPSQYQKRANR